MCARSALTVRDLSKQRANLAGPFNICLSLYIGHFRLVSASSVTSSSICISGSRCTIVSFMLSMNSSSVREIFTLSVNHELIPSMQMPTKLKTTTLK